MGILLQNKLMKEEFNGYLLLQTDFMTKYWLKVSWMNVLFWKKKQYFVFKIFKIFVLLMNP